jgi:hypothetical protein
VSSRTARAIQKSCLEKPKKKKKKETGLMKIFEKLMELENTVLS